MYARLSLKKKTTIAAIMLAAISSVAYAYWTTTGSGSATAPTGTSSSVTVNQTTTLTAMYPGDTAQTLSGTFDNSSSGPQRVASVTVSIGSVVKAGGAPSGTCTASDFTLANTTMTVNQDVPAGTSQGTWTGATIKFNNTGANQDACKGATVNLSYAAA